MLTRDGLGELHVIDAADPAGPLAKFAGDPVRLLRGVSLPLGAVVEPVGATTVVAVVDTETTGFDCVDDVVIELALRRVRIDELGRIVEIGRGQTWRDDPGRPLSREIARLTGLTDTDLHEQRIDVELATRMLISADWICAHNSSFDRRFVERRLPDAAGGRWCCSCVDVDWAERGLDGRSLGWLLSQVGLCHAGHRALNDVDATIALLASEHAGRTAFCEMLSNAAAPAWRVRAVGASFEVKDLLRRRGYKWQADSRVWQREVPDRDRTLEESWLAKCVYSDDARPRALGPGIEPVDPTKRFL